MGGVSYEVLLSEDYHLSDLPAHLISIVISGEVFIDKLRLDVFEVFQGYTGLFWLPPAHLRRYR